MISMSPHPLSFPYAVGREVSEMKANGRPNGRTITPKQSRIHNNNSRRRRSNNLLSIHMGIDARSEGYG
jgi:hypothetical protein